MNGNIFILFSTDMEKYNQLKSRQPVDDRLLQFYLPCIWMAAFESEEDARRHCQEFNDEFHDKYYFVEELILFAHRPEYI